MTAVLLIIVLHQGHRVDAHKGGPGTRTRRHAWPIHANAWTGGMVGWHCTTWRCQPILLAGLQC